MRESSLDQLTFRQLLEAPISNITQIRHLKAVMKYLGLSLNDSILSVGTGNGLDCFIISKRVREVVGIDISEAMIKILNETMRQPNLQFYAIDATKGPPSEFVNKFDKCICTEVLEHVENPVGLLQFIGTALKRGGRAVITFPTNNPSHGCNYLTEEQVLPMFEKTSLSKVSIWNLEPTTVSRLTDRLYFIVQRTLKPTNPEANRFEDTTAFKMIKKPARFDFLYKLGIVSLSTLPWNTYVIKKGNSSAVLVVAEKV